MLLEGCWRWMPEKRTTRMRRHMEVIGRGHEVGRCQRQRCSGQGQVEEDDDGNSPKEKEIIHI